MTANIGSALTRLLRERAVHKTVTWRLISYGWRFLLLTILLHFSVALFLALFLADTGVTAWYYLHEKAWDRYASKRGPAPIVPTLPAFALWRKNT